MQRLPSTNRRGKITSGRGGGGCITPFKEKPKDYCDVAHPDPYSLDEMRAWFFEGRKDFWYEHQMPITANALDELIGKKRAFADRTRQELLKINERFFALGKYLSDITKRRVLLLKGWHVPRVVWTSPPENPPAIHRLSLIGAWALHARCKSCGDNRWLPIMMGGKEHVACYGCFPPDQYSSVGATLLPKSLIYEAAKAYY